MEKKRIIGVFCLIGILILGSTQAVALQPRGIPADVNGDGVVDVLDLLLVLGVWDQTGSPGWIPEDINLDGVIDVLDLLEVLTYWT